MTVKTLWALSVEDSAQHKHAAEAQAKATKDAKKYVTDRIKCDGIFLTTSNSIFLGFKECQDNPQLHKKPRDYYKGCHLYSTKAKTEWNQILIEAEKIARSAIKFDDYCKELWPKMVISSIGSEGGGGFSLSNTSFGFLSDRVVAMVPFGDGAVDKSIIAEGFQELTASEYAELK